MLRLLLALPVALVLTAGLFTFMAWMVGSGQQAAPEEKQRLAFDMVMVEQEREVRRRQRIVPEPPETPERPPEAMPATGTQAAVTAVVPDMPSIALDTAVSGVAISIPQFSGFEANRQAMPLYRVEPRYPARAMTQGAEGYVVIAFTIDPQGRPTEIKVTDAKPRRLFEREAIRALRKWKYQPKVIDGKAVAQLDQTVRLEFKLDK